MEKLIKIQDKITGLDCEVIRASEDAIITVLLSNGHKVQRKIKELKYLDGKENA
jgi:hypothetical protein